MVNMKEFLKNLRKHEEVWNSAKSNGGTVRYMLKGYKGYGENAEQDKSLIRDTNIKYFNVDSDELLGDFVVVDFECGSSIRFLVEDLKDRFEESGWEGIESLIMSNVIAAVNLNSPATDFVKCLESYDTAKDRLIIRAVKKTDFLGSFAHRTVGDIALVLYGIVSAGEGLNTAKIPLEIVKKWGDVDDIINNALENTLKLYEPRIYADITDAFSNDSDVGEFMSKDSLRLSFNRGSAPMVTTNKRLNGATAMFIPGVQEKLYNLIGNEYYVVFTSIHEAMLHIDGTVTVDQMKRSLANVNRHFGDEETLTWNIYKYDSTDQTLKMI